MATTTTKLSPPELDHLRMESSQSANTIVVASSPQASAFVVANPVPSRNGSADESFPLLHSNRTLVLCFDGTGDQFDSDNSNIVEFFSLLKKDDPSKQLVYYQAGIGTYTVPQIATPMFAKFSKMVDEGIAWNLDAHIMGGYEFIMQNYHSGDRICIFGFSRGAYTARCLAGMIHKVGLLPVSNNQQVPFAYKMYTRTDDLGWKQSNAFKKAFSIDVDIEFLGVWDTVNSVGLIPRRLPFTTSNTVVSTFRHAVSLDEHRAKFKANLWNRPLKDEEFLSISDQKLAKQAQKGKASSSPTKVHHHKDSLKILEGKYGAKDRLKPTDVDEVWFSGAHCDIGGGSVATGLQPCLARIPLRWMIRECFKTNSGIMFHVDGLKEIGLDPATICLPRPPAIPVDPTNPQVFISPIPKTQPTDEEIAHIAEENLKKTEEELELADALSPIYDQLQLHWMWWILEIIPLRHRFQTKDNKWVTSWKWNLGEGRHIPRQETMGMRVHRSVKARLDSEYKDGRKYWPNADQFDLKYVTWVD